MEAISIAASGFASPLIHGLINGMGVLPFAFTTFWIEDKPAGAVLIFAWPIEPSLLRLLSQFFFHTSASVHISQRGELIPAERLAF